MARIRQFAKDMGLSYNEAKNLVNKGRKLRDGGSSVLESEMSEVKLTKKQKPKKRPETAQQKYMKEVIKQKGRSGQLDAEGRPNPYGGLDRKEGGSIKKMRGGGLAIQGLGFRGVR